MSAQEEIKPTRTTGDVLKDVIDSNVQRLIAEEAQNVTSPKPTKTLGDILKSTSEYELVIKESQSNRYTMNKLCLKAAWLTGVNRLYLIPTIHVYFDNDCWMRFGITFEWLKFEISLDSGY